MDGFKPENIDSAQKLNMESMGELCQLSGTIGLEGGQELQANATNEDKKTYGRNNGFLSFVTEGGVQYVTKDSSEKVSELKMAGYKETALGVPFSNGERPESGSQAYDTWEAMVRG